MEDLIGWAERVALRPVALRPEDVFQVADARIAFSISRHHDMYPVEASAPGGERFLLGVFEDIEDARRFFAMQLGTVLRARERMPRLVARELTPGFVIEEAPTALWLSWFTGSAEFPIGDLSRRRAVNFSRVERAPLDAIQSSYLHPLGRPLYLAA